jgi:hypothetical protein
MTNQTLTRRALLGGLGKLSLGSAALATLGSNISRANTAASCPTDHDCRLECLIADYKENRINPVLIGPGLEIDTDLTKGPIILDQPERTYILTKDITSQDAINSASSGCVYIKAPKIKLNLAGHKISYPYEVAVFIEGDEVTIENGELKGLYNAVYSTGNQGLFKTLCGSTLSGAPSFDIYGSDNHFEKVSAENGVRYAIFHRGNIAERSNFLNAVSGDQSNLFIDCQINEGSEAGSLTRKFTYTPQLIDALGTPLRGSMVAVYNQADLSKPIFWSEVNHNGKISAELTDYVMISGIKSPEERIKYKAAFTLPNGREIKRDIEAPNQVGPLEETVIAA